MQKWRLVQSSYHYVISLQYNYYSLCYPRVYVLCWIEYSRTIHYHALIRYNSRSPTKNVSQDLLNSVTTLSYINNMKEI
jgi:hypothetical protein